MGSQKVGHALVTKQQQEALHNGGVGGAARPGAGGPRGGGESEGR